MFGINNNFTTYQQINQTTASRTNFTYSILSQNFKLPFRFNLSDQIQYEYLRNEFSLMKAELYRPIFSKSYISFNATHDFRTKIHEIGIGFRTDFSFAQTAFSARRKSNQESTFSESAMGSFYYDGSTRHLGTNNRSSVGKGGLIILTFLDINGNGLFDKGEPKIDAKNLVVNGGRILHDEHDTVVRITDLEPYRAYTVELNRNSFDNIAWQLKNATLRIFVDPNIMKVVEVPVNIVGEASGSVYRMNAKEQKGIGRINVLITRKDGTIAAKTLTEEDGFYSYLGLNPGNYLAQIDTAQLRKIQCIASPSKIPFTIKWSIEGDYKEGLDFELKSMQDSFIPSNSIISSDSTSPAAANEIYIIQAGIFQFKRNVNKLWKAYHSNTPFPFTIFEENGLYILRTESLTLNEANTCYKWMQDNQRKSIMKKLITEGGISRFVFIK